MEINHEEKQEIDYESNIREKRRVDQVDRRFLDDPLVENHYQKELLNTIERAKSIDYQDSEIIQ